MESISLPEKFKKERLISDGLLSHEQYRALQLEIYATREHGFQMKPVDQMVQYIHRLQAEGHTLRVATSRFDESLEIAKEWSQQVGIELEFYGLGYGNSKAPALEGFDIYIDDDLDKLEQIIDTVPHRFLFSWAYNLDSETLDIASRIHSWEEFYRVVNELKRKL